MCHPTERDRRVLIEGFSRPSKQTVFELQQEIVPRGGHSLEELLLQDQDGRLWILNTVGNVDPLRPPRARFGYLLGAPFANVTQIELLSESDAQVLQQVGLREATERCFLARIASHYERQELPCLCLDSAVAGELVFSLWIRRRDTHNMNRAYTADGIPVFFDFDVAFLAENEGEELSEFFGRGGLGYAGSWRVREVPGEDLPISTEYARAMGNQSSIHPITSLGGFRQYCVEIAEAIADDHRSVRHLAVEARLGNAELDKVVHLLERGRSSIRDDINTMLRVVTQEDYDNNS